MPSSAKKTTRRVLSSRNSKAKPASTKRDRAASIRRILDVEQTVKERLAALTSIPDVLADKETFDAVVTVLSNREGPASLRYEALATLQAAAFQAQSFAAYRTAFLAALRKLRSDPDIELRQRVLGTLSREKDASTQEALLTGLGDPSRALVSPEKALQLLSYDVHAGAYDIARKIAQQPPNPLARREALRILATSAESTDYFDDMLRNKGEPMPMRQIAAQSLNRLAPDRLQSAARAVAIDHDEDPDVKSLGLTALTNFGDVEALIKDQALMEHVAKLKESSDYEGSPLQSAADAFQQRCAKA